jgi:ComF family protein
MGLFSALAQCALDFLVDERCHACGGHARDSARPLFASHPLATPVTIATFPLHLTTRVLCLACAGIVARWRAPVRLDGSLWLYPAFVTDERLLAVIHLMKFGRRECLAPWLAGAMTSALPSPVSDPPGEWRVVPVPMDRRARSRRGFNQAESLARSLAVAWQLPLLSPEALAKVRPTRPQSALGRAERLQNLDGAFRAVPQQVRDARMILVDDLVTTGATVRACARALRAAGAREVRVVCAGYRDEPGPAQAPLLQS